MTSTTTRYPIKPKTLTLLELCQSINNFRHPPPSISSYQYQSLSTAAQILTRRLYLHPLNINSNSKQPLPKISTTISLIPSDNEQRHQLNSDKNHEKHHTKNKSSYHGLAILSSSFPLITRINTKHNTRHSCDKQAINTVNDTNSDYDSSIISIYSNQSSLPLITRINTKPNTRHSRDKQAINIFNDTNNDYDFSTISFYSNQSNLPLITQGTSSGAHIIRTRPLHVMNHKKTYPKSTRREKVDVWNNLDRVLERPLPIDPPTTPLDISSDYNTEYDEPQKQDLNYSSIQGIKIYKRNPIHNLVIDDDYIYNED